MGGEIILLSNKQITAASPLYWKSGVIRKVCTSPKAAETRSLLKTVDDSTSMARQISMLMNRKIQTRIFTDSRPLLESTGKLGQIEEKALRQSVASLKQMLEEGEISRYSWIEGKEIVADVFSKSASTRESLDEITRENIFRHAQSKDNLVQYENEEIMIMNLATKSKKA